MATNHSTAPESGDSVKVLVRSDWASKINILQVAAVASAMAAYFGLSVDPATISAILAGMIAAQGLVTVVMRTYFTTSVTTSSASGMKSV